MVKKNRIEYVPIYDEEIVSHRRDRKTPDEKGLWEYANVYLQPRNPMMYRVVNERKVHELAVVGILPEVMDIPGAMFSIGNAASHFSRILPAKQGIGEISKIWKTIHAEWWTEEDGAKRKIMAECLVPERIPVESIHSIYFASGKAAQEAGKRVDIPSTLPLVPESNIFFQPNRKIPIADNVSLIDGDMFFSNMQTVTISVNTVGVMGKGLASRAKYQFPGVYVHYQDACRRKRLKMGRPCIYKREIPLEDQLIDNPTNSNGLKKGKWFLLFPTKSHWRQNSDFQGIQAGLDWLRNNYQKEDIESLAIPALGCGLGNLDWKEVGPIMCQTLSKMDIRSAVYLPREKNMSEEHLSRNFLLGL